METLVKGLVILVIAYGLSFVVILLGLSPFVVYEWMTTGTKLTTEFWATVVASWLGVGAILTALCGIATLP